MEEFDRFRKDRSDRDTSYESKTKPSLASRDRLLRCFLSEQLEAATEASIKAGVELAHAKEKARFYEERYAFIKEQLDRRLEEV